MYQDKREVEFNYIKAAYDHPYILYAFAAGNSGTYNTINCPGNSKNVLTVSSSSFISSSYLEFFQSTLTVSQFGENESKMSPRNDVGFGTPFLDRIIGLKDTGLRFIDNETIRY